MAPDKRSKHYAIQRANEFEHFIIGLLSLECTEQCYDGTAKGREIADLSRIIALEHRELVTKLCHRVRDCLKDLNLPVGTEEELSIKYAEAVRKINPRLAEAIGMTTTKPEPSDIDLSKIDTVGNA